MFSLLCVAQILFLWLLMMLWSVIVVTLCYVVCSVGHICFAPESLCITRRITSHPRSIDVKSMLNTIPGYSTDIEVTSKQ